MPIDCIPFKETPYFSNLICDYLDQEDKLKSFYSRFPTLENFKAQIEEKSLTFGAQSRNLIVANLLNQYKGFEVSTETQLNINSLKENNDYYVKVVDKIFLFIGLNLILPSFIFLFLRRSYNNVSSFTFTS